MSWSERARKLLEKIEWPTEAWCPDCGESREKGHRPYCELRALLNEPQLYCCPDCSWVGPACDMLADHTSGGVEEWWCNHICPKCKTWRDLLEYNEVH